MKPARAAAIIQPVQSSPLTVSPSPQPRRWPAGARCDTIQHSGERSYVTRRPASPRLRRSVPYRPTFPFLAELALAHHVGLGAGWERRVQVETVLLPAPVPPSWPSPVTQSVPLPAPGRG